MAIFRYLAFSAEGTREVGKIEAEDRAAAWSALRTMGLTVAEIVEATADRPARDIVAGRRRRLPIALQADLAQLLAVLFRAHLSAPDLVRIVAATSENPEIRGDFGRIGRLIEEGKDFSDAFGHVAWRYSDLFASLVGVAESTSAAPEVFTELSAALHRQEKTRQELVGALVYPIVLSVAGIGVLSLVSFYLVPRLEPLFESSGRPLPTALAVFKAFGEILKLAALSAPIWLSGFGLAWLVGARNPRLIRKVRSAIPLWGNIALKAALMRLARSLHLMLVAGVSLPDALLKAESHFRNEVFADGLVSASERVQQGLDASSALRNDPAFPAEFTELFGLGERTNSLVDLTRTMAELLEQEVDHDTKRISAAITPILTLLLGVLVGTVAYSVMSAILSINDLAG